MKIYTDWCVERNNFHRLLIGEDPITKCLDAMTDDELDVNLAKFIAEIKKSMAQTILDTRSTKLFHHCRLS